MNPTHILELPDMEHHELLHTWTYWYLIPNRVGAKSTNWDDFLKALHSFHSIEDFWAIFNSIDPPYKLPKGCRYYIFKEGIKPVWEDPKNDGGFDISIEYDVSRIQDVQQKWITIVTGALGNTMPHCQYINGVEFNNKGQKVKIGYWLSKAPDFVTKEIVNVFRERVDARDVRTTRIQSKQP